MKLVHVIAYANEIDEQVLEKLHAKCVEEVRGINGVIDFGKAYQYQKKRK